MNTSVNKASNKRKSFGGKNKSPAKVAKLNVSLDSPKTEATNEKSPKKPLKGDKKGYKTQNGVGPKLENFKGLKSLEPKTENAGNETEKQKSKTKRMRGVQNKKVFLLSKMKKRVETEGQEAVVKDLNQRIDAIVSQSEVSKTNKRTLRSLKFILNSITGETKVTAPQATKKQNKKDEAKKVVPTKEEKKKPVQKVENKKANAKQNKKNNKPVESEKEEDKEDESDEDVETSFKDVSKAEFEDDSDEEDSGDEEEVSGEEDEDSDDDEEEDDDEEDDDEEESDEAEETEKKVQPKKVIKSNDAKPQQKKSRYVLFVGNLAYDTTKDEIKEHFKKVGEVVDVRIPTDRESNRPRGFAYVEVSDEAAYQKSLTLNGSQLKNRKIRVDYTQGPNKNSEERNKNIKAKNFKLHAMSKQGQRGGPKNGSPFKGKNRK